MSFCPFCRSTNVRVNPFTHHRKCGDCRRKWDSEEEPRDKNSYFMERAASLAEAGAKILIIAPVEDGATMRVETKNGGEILVTNGIEF